MARSLAPLPAIALALAGAACTSTPAPEQIALDRAASLLASHGKPGATILAPLFGIDAIGEAGLCALIETPAGPVRLVAALRPGTIRLGQPVTRQRLPTDLGESRFCTPAARARWQRKAQADPNGLAAELGS